MTDHKPRVIAIMGSGETAPTMTKTHRDLLARLGPRSQAVILDTPYGFQENAPELAQRAVDYFEQSIGHSAIVAGLTRLKAGSTDGDVVDDVAVEQGFNRVREANYIFAGPGSPTYALQQWRETPLPEIVASKVRNGGIVTFSSAAALTLGRFTVPVYEIYKVGSEPYWLDGLDVLAEIGLKVAIIPHFDNAEGGHHDTRFCYLGQRRLDIMENLLPEDAHVIGIDEHTGLVIDIDEGSATVVGNGTVTIRISGRSTVHVSGTTIPVEALKDPGAVSRAVSPRPTHETPRETTATSLSHEVDRATVAFDEAMNSGTADSAVRAVLDLESAIHQWSADTLQSDETNRARAVLRSMITRLGDAAVNGLIDPRLVIAPFVDTLMDLRAQVRTDKRYDLSDLIRDRLVETGVEVHDTPQGATWELRRPE